MQAFTHHTGTAVPLERVNVDTDQIIPKQFLKSIKRTGFGDYLFDAWRFNDAGDLGMTPNERDINREFVLILKAVTIENIGKTWRNNCGEAVFL